MNSENNPTALFACIIATTVLSMWFFIPLYSGYQKYIQFPKTQQQTQCRVQETNAMKWSGGNFQAIWTVDYNDSESEKISKIFVMNYTTFTDAVEATMNQYKIGQVYKCYFNKKKSYDVLWTIDDKVKDGRNNLIIAFICGTLLVIIWTISIGYFCHKWYKNTMGNPRKI